MRRIFSFIVAGAAFCACAPKSAELTVAVVPQPVKIQQFEGTAKSTAASTKISGRLAAEEYILDSRSGRVKIIGGSEAGVFYALKTLEQLRLQAVDGRIARVLIKDKPQFSYRGAHLDCCRHFFGVDRVREFIDMMAMHKLNTFHWHLTEDQGWRFESRKYPKLQEISAWRNGTMKEQEWGSNDGIRHGGYFTQEEMKEIVAYAAERHITVIPEIEMPGHAIAALAAYPELGCTGGPYEVCTQWGVHSDIFCVGKDATIRFLEDILDEVCEIFPSEYIHIGGDEAPRDRWKECPDCQARMKAEGLESEAELQSWLNLVIEKYLADKGRKIIGWDEILEGGVSEDATVMSWRGPKGGKAAASKGNDVIMSPNNYYYFDYYQTEGAMENGEPLSIGGHVNLRQAYSFDPFEDLDGNTVSHIKGIQANMWTEYISEWDGVMYRELPRISALAEVAWNSDGRTSYEDFVKRVETALVPQYKAEGWSYADFAFRTPEID